MKKRYIIAFLFLLLININVVYGDDVVYGDESGYRPLTKNIEESYGTNCEDLLSANKLDKTDGNILFDSSPNYDIDCTYYRDAFDGKILWIFGDGKPTSCLVLQISYNSETGEYAYGYNGEDLNQTGGLNITSSNLKTKKTSELTNKAKINEFFKKQKGICPRVHLNVEGLSFRQEFTFSVQGGDHEMKNMFSTNIGDIVPNLIIKGDSSKETCKDIIGEAGIKILKTVYNLVKIGIPLLLIGLGILDFAKAVFASGEDEMKKAQAKFIKRLIIALLAFVVPYLLQFVLKIAGGIWPAIDSSLCGVLD